MSFPHPDYPIRLVQLASDVSGDENDLWVLDTNIQELELLAARLDFVATLYAHAPRLEHVAYETLDDGGIRRMRTGEKEYLAVFSELDDYRNRHAWWRWPPDQPLSGEIRDLYTTQSVRFCAEPGSVTWGTYLPRSEGGGVVEYTVGLGLKEIYFHMGHGDHTRET